MIARIWHGWTSFENAQLYENLLKNEVFPSIEEKKVTGYKKIYLLKRRLDSEVEFVTIMLFEDLKAVRDFAGVNYQKSYVPQKARQVLKRHDEASHHYEILEELQY